MEEMRAKAKEVTEFLKVLANENRMLILCELLEGPMSVGDLLTKLKISQSGISQHLAVLKHMGILDSDKKGQKVMYRIEDRRIYAVMEALKDAYCR